MSDSNKSNVTRRTLLKAGAALPLLGVAAPAILAQGAKTPTKVLDFLTYADVAKAEQEGQFVFYCHENEAGTAAIMEGFGKDFPKIKTSYVRAQTGALYNKILSERSAGRFDVDVIQLSDVAPAVDFEKSGGYELYVGPETPPTRRTTLSTPAGSFFWTGVTFAGIAYNKTKVKPQEAPKTYKDITIRAAATRSAARFPRPASSTCSGTLLRKIYGNDFWKEFAKQRPRAFDSRVQLFDRLAKGDDDITRDRRIFGLRALQGQGRRRGVRRARRGAGRDAADRRRGEQGAASGSRQAVRRLGDVEPRPEILPGSTRTSITARCATTRRRCRPGRSSPTQADLPDGLGRLRGKQRDVFNKEWNAMLGL